MAALMTRFLESTMVTRRYDGVVQMQPKQVAHMRVFFMYLSP